MMPRRDAEYYRFHGRCLAKARELGVTPAEARIHVKLDDLRERSRARQRRRSDRGPVRASDSDQGLRETRDEPWMMRD
ncbi:MAG: hypothetical protein AAFR88_09360 [Pseudomonadota bacterium]